MSEVFHIALLIAQPHLVLARRNLLESIGFDSPGLILEGGILTDCLPGDHPANLRGRSHFHNTPLSVAYSITGRHGTLIAASLTGVMLSFILTLHPALPGRRHGHKNNRQSPVRLAMRMPESPQHVPAVTHFGSAVEIAGEITSSDDLAN